MDGKNKAQLDAQVMVIKSIAHQTRLFIINELSKQERCVCELTKMIEADISTVSKHLSVLKNAGIVSCEKRGCQIYYRLKIPCILSFLYCVNIVAKSNAKEHLVLLK
jgi:ArsR family transcriptional regulator